MRALKDLLPVPVKTTCEKDDRGETKKLQVGELRSVPPYGSRSEWVPRCVEDFGNGGAFPEILFAQYPLGTGSRNQKTASNALPDQLDTQGRLKYDIILGHSRKNKITFHRLHDLFPSEVLNDDDPSLQKPNEEEIMSTAESTKVALKKLVRSKLSADVPSEIAEQSCSDEYIRYTPSQQGTTFSSRATQRIVRVVKAQKDPMEPQRFEINKKIPYRPPSPPVPVLHSPPRRVTVKDQKAWRVPPCISLWKSYSGYVIPLDLRADAEPRNTFSKVFNQRALRMAEAMCIAERKAREEVEMRAQCEKRLGQKAKEKKEEELRQLAQETRERRIGVRSVTANEQGEAWERDAIRLERRSKRQRERNIAHVAPNKCRKLAKQHDRDISEQIALGLPNASQNCDGELQIDQHLLNQSSGLDDSFGDDDDYNVYDKPWTSSEVIHLGTLRTRMRVNKDLYGEFSDKLVKACRFQQSNFSVQRDGPVQFKKDDDPFGLDKFLKAAKEAKKQLTDQTTCGANQDIKEV